MSTSATAPATGQPPHSSAPPAPRPGLVLAVITGFMLLIGIDVTVVNLALPRMGDALDMSRTSASWVLNAYTLAFGGSLLLAGRLGDVFGRKRAFLAGATVFTGASLLAGCAPWAWWLITARVLQGLGGALAGPSTMALIVSTFDGRARARAISWYSAVLGGGASVGLVLGGVITDLASWRWVFLINVPLGALVIALAARLITEPARARTDRPRRFDVAGALTATAGMGALVHAFIRAAAHEWRDARTIGSLIAAAVLLIAFVCVEKRAAEPLTPLRLATRGTLARVLPAITAAGAAMFSVLFLLAQYFQDVRGFGTVRAGFAFLPLMVGQFTVARLSPSLVRRVGTAWPAAVGLALVATGLAWLGGLDEHDTYVGGVLGPLLLIGIGIGASMPTMNTYGMSGIDPRESGAASGLLQTMQWIGGTLGLAVWVTVFGAATRDASSDGSPEHVLTHGIATAFAAAALCAAAAFAAALPLFRRRRGN
ncbi:MFS transporter [Embleya hyalina]|uniref:MFS transporter n=1 Tax=Embleya hyalina TaxID=516124 RepID=A0A401YMF9_9ACTN|nr:MFS transporter [Embleya hyalina]GCD95767.1 MFS transporter [Embleya hyalina]